MKNKTWQTLYIILILVGLIILVINGRSSFDNQLNKPLDAEPQNKTSESRPKIQLKPSDLKAVGITSKETITTCSQYKKDSDSIKSVLDLKFMVCMDKYLSDPKSAAQAGQVCRNFVSQIEDLAEAAYNQCVVIATENKKKT